MPKRTAFVGAIGVHPRRQKGNTPLRRHFMTMLGTPFEDFASTAWVTTPPDKARSVRHSRLHSDFDFTEHEDVVLLSARVGFYGEPGTIVHEETGDIIYEHSGELAPLTRARLGIIQDSHSRAFVIVEKTATGHLYDQFKTSLNHHRDETKRKVTFEHSRVERGDEWLETAAYLQKLTIICERKTSDVAEVKDVPLPRKVAYVASNMGDAPLRGKILRKLMGRTVLPSDLVKIPEEDGLEEQEVRLTVTDGRQERTFVLDADSGIKTPAFYEAIPTTETNGIPTDQEFIRFCRDVSERLMM